MPPQAQCPPGTVVEVLPGQVPFMPPSLRDAMAQKGDRGGAKSCDGKAHGRDGAQAAQQLPFRCSASPVLTLLS